MNCSNQILCGDAVDVLKTVPSSSCRCSVTSPPYYALRNYGVEGQIGLERTPAEYIDRLVCAFREVKRILTDDGTLWIVIADSYAGGGNGPSGSSVQASNAGAVGQCAKAAKNVDPGAIGCKPKDLIGIPWMLAFALRDDGWYLRQEIIWQKPNPMPESVTDRCTKSHESIFLLSKSPRYYFDHEAILEPVAESAKGRKPVRFGSIKGQDYVPDAADPNFRAGNDQWGRLWGYTKETRNKRDVWTVANAPFSGAHFASYPPELIRPCILAGSQEGDTVLDPFFGSGTTGLVAVQEGRYYIGCELNPQYIPMAKSRIQNYGHKQLAFSGWNLM